VKNQAVAAFTAIQGLAVIRRRVQSPRPLPSRAESFLRGSATAVPPPGPCPYGAAPAGAATLSLRDALGNGEDARIDVTPPGSPICRCREGAAAGS
jgi:hypothetical protein